MRAEFIQADGVCVGEHVAASLASEATARIARLEAENARLRHFTLSLARRLRDCSEAMTTGAERYGRMIRELRAAIDQGRFQG